LSLGKDKNFGVVGIQMMLYLFLFYTITPVKKTNFEMFWDFFLNCQNFKPVNTNAEIYKYLQKL
jgi:hypothetical protein